MINALTQERLCEVLDFDPGTGIFRWKVSNSNRVKVGDTTGNALVDGYRVIRVDRRNCLAHRLAWLYVNGVWPAMFVDHINGDRADNRILNLRESDRSGNGQNLPSRRPANKSCGLLGVSPKNGRWRAYIKVGGKNRHLGMFDTPEQAHAVYVRAKLLSHPFAVLGRMDGVPVMTTEGERT